MDKKAKYTIPFALLILVTFVVGCSFSKSKQNADSNIAPNGNNQPAASVNVSPENADLPKPTGKIDDVTGAILDDANKEEGVTSSETDSAKSAVASDQDVNDISNSYDKDAL